ncbi:peptidoglycan-binding protein [Streptomyces sp. NPDC049597]|uniref:peptidoglycan-binding domain-containing protein n=1 Tax=Streptomyces sp. NPDC049597 TaxID=3155276 RepID=UPI003415CC28
MGRGPGHELLPRLRADDPADGQAVPAPGRLDGTFGTVTDAGVRAVQKCSGIAVDGQVGPQAWRHLGTPTPGCGH